MNANPFASQQSKSSLKAELNTLRDFAQSRPGGNVATEVARLKAELAITQGQLAQAKVGGQVETLKAELNALKDVARQRADGAVTTEVARLKAELALTRGEIDTAKKQVGETASPMTVSSCSRICLRCKRTFRRIALA